MEPKTPNEAAEFMMERFRPYLPDREREELGRLVAELVRDWGELKAEVASYEY